MHWKTLSFNANIMHNAFDGNHVFYSNATCDLTSYYPACLEKRDDVYESHPFMIVATSSTSFARDDTIGENCASLHD